MLRGTHHHPHSMLSVTHTIINKLLETNFSPHSQIDLHVSIAVFLRVNPLELTKWKNCLPRRRTGSVGKRRGGGGIVGNVPHTLIL